MLLLHATVRPTEAEILVGYNHSQIVSNNDIHTRKLKKNEGDRSTATKLIAGHDLDLEKVRKKAKFFYGNKPRTYEIETNYAPNRRVS